LLFWLGSSLFPALGFPTVELVAIQGWPRAVIGGLHTRFEAVATNDDGALSYQWFHNSAPAPFPGSQSSTLTIAHQTAGGAGYYFVVVSNSAGMATSSVVRLDVGVQNFEFNTTNGPQRWVETPVLSSVWSVLRLRNGQVLVGGPFEQVEGLEWRHLARLNPDGSLDRTFTARPNRPVRAMIEQPDGRILIAGEFNGVSGQFRDRVARLEPDGNLDTNFPGRLGLNGIMHALALQPDGKVIVGGAFHVARNDAPWIHNIIRLETNGLIDFTFDPGTNLFTANIASNFVRAVAVLADGKIMAGGNFNRAARSGRDYLARLLPDGALDPMFGVEPLRGPNGPVYSMAQAGGLLVIGGSFTNFHGVARTNLARLLPDGSVDETFLPQPVMVGFSVARGYINALAADHGGRVLAVHSEFEDNGNNSNSRVFRFDASGRIDTNQTSSYVGRGGFPAGISTLALNDDGGTYIGGTFDSIDGVTRRRVALLLGDLPGPPTFSLQPTNLFAEPGLPAVLNANVRISASTTLQWFHDGEPVDDGTNALLLLPLVMPPDAGGYWLVASNRYGMTTSAVATITVLDPLRPGAVDFSFAPMMGANSNIWALAPGPEGSIYIGGDFTQYDGIDVTGLARIDRFGALDTNFLPRLVRSTQNPPSVYALHARMDGTLLVAGYFYVSANGQTGNSLVSLKSDGTLDPAFRFSVDARPLTALAEDEHGRILVGGNFPWLINNLDQRYLIRVLPNGAHDLSFKFGNRLNQVVEAVAVDEQGRVLAAGTALSLPNASLSWDLMRLDGKGVLDNSFGFSGTKSCTGGGGGRIPISQGDCGRVNALLVEPDGGILIGGVFNGGYLYCPNSSCPHDLSGLARLNPDGSPDGAFTAGGGVAGAINAMVRQGDGKILVGGTFVRVNGASRTNMARLQLDGTVDASLDAGSRAGDVSAMLVRPDGKIVVAGGFTKFNGHRRGRVAILHGGISSAPMVTSSPTNFVLLSGNPLRLSPVIAGYPPPTLQWIRNGVPVPGATQAVLRLTNSRVADSGTYSLIASNASGVTTSVVATVIVEPPPIQAGLIDPGFASGTGSDGEVFDLDVQRDGRILIAGAFRSVDGVPRTRIARLLPDGRLDMSFDPARSFAESSSNDLNVARIISQPDGKILVNGYFRMARDGTARTFVRLNADGSLDEGFPVVGGWPLLAQPDGKILLGGFSEYVRRLHMDGTLDASFQVDTISNYVVRAAALETQGRIITVADSFPYVVRLMPDGTRDMSFSIGMDYFNGRPIDSCFMSCVGGAGGGCGAGPHLLDVVVQPDGRILVGGVFSRRSSGEKWNLLRLLSSGAPDPTFRQWGGPNYAVRAIALQPDGKILIGGCFTNVGDGVTNTARHHIARLNPDGSVDPSFNPGAGFLGTSDGYVRALALQPDGRVVLGGVFNTVDGVRRNNFARLTGEIVLFETTSDDSFFTTRVATTEGRTYWLETRESPDEGGWTAVGSVAGDGTDQVLTDAASNTGKRFYRVRVE